MTSIDRSPLDPAELRTSLAGLVSDLVVTEATASTNADLAAAALAGAPAGTVHTTDHQTKGRGRLDRGFEMPARTGIAMSLLLRPDVAVSRWTWLPLVAGLAVADTVAALGVEAQLKWPNDVLVDGRKICGILVERVETDEGPAAVIGIGLNVSQTRDELPVPTATSLRLEGATSIDRAAVLITLMFTLRGWTDRWAGAAPDTAWSIRDEYVRRCDTVGRQVAVQLPDGLRLTGLAEGVDEFGRLLVDGISVAAGDVVHVRPA